MGFGFSQVLPIVAQLWASKHAQRDYRFGNNAQQFVVIEQPELHLHPAFQAKLADIFAKSVSKDSEISREGRRQLRIMAETHSPSLINRLGQLIAAGKVEKDDVQVVLFEQAENSDATTVTIATFDDQGVLTNWPFGFFEPDYQS
jgi:predicted ATPase